MTFDGRTVLITGAARGQGRSHAVEFARRGAQIVASDLCGELDASYPSSTQEDLDTTRRAVEELGSRCLAMRADVRVQSELDAVVAATLSTFGRIDVLVANAGILNNAPIWELDAQRFANMLDTNLCGTFNAVKAVLPAMLERGSGRIIIAISSMAGRRAYGRAAHYAASKWGIIGLIKDIALDLAPTGITANVICPGSVNTVMAVNDSLARTFRPDLSDPTVEDLKAEMTKFHPQGIPWVEPVDVSEAVLFLASDGARYITGEVLTVSGGMSAQNSS